jgi:hypothetical protein
VRLLATPFARELGDLDNDVIPRRSRTAKGEKEGGARRDET